MKNFMILFLGLSALFSTNKMVQAQNNFLKDNFKSESVNRNHFDLKKSEEKPIINYADNQHYKFSIFLKNKHKSLSNNLALIDLVLLHWIIQYLDLLNADKNIGSHSFLPTKKTSTIPPPKLLEHDVKPIFGSPPCSQQWDGDN